MATATGVIDAINLIKSTPGDAAPRKVWEIVCRFPAYTGSTDSATVLAVGAAIKAARKDGGTRTLRAAFCGYPGLDTNAQLVYTGAVTVSTDDLTFNLTAADGTELTSATASSGVSIFVVAD